MNLCEAMHTMSLFRPRWGRTLLSWQPENYTSFTHAPTHALHYTGDI